MPNQWNDEQITQVLLRTAPILTKTAAMDRTWLKIEDRVRRRKKNLWNLMTWRPWAHPGGWLAASACLCITLTGTFYRQNQMDNNDFDSYLVSMSNPTANVAYNPDEMNTPLLLAEESPTATSDTLLSDEDHSDSLLEN